MSHLSVDLQWINGMCLPVQHNPRDNYCYRAYVAHFQWWCRCCIVLCCPTPWFSGTNIWAFFKPDGTVLSRWHFSDISISLPLVLSLITIIVLQFLQCSLKMSMELLCEASCPPPNFAPSIVAWISLKSLCCSYKSGKWMIARAAAKAERS